MKFLEDTIVNKLKKWNKAYRSGDPIVTDSEYDAKVEELRELNSEHPYLHKPEPEPKLGNRGTLTHTHLMLSTDKVYVGTDELERFVKRCQTAFSKVNSDGYEGLTFRITAKLDGMAARTYKDGKAGTRGEDGLTGTDISDLVEKLTVVGTGFGDGELIIPTDYFNDNFSREKLGDVDGFAYPRNFMAGMCGAETLKEHHIRAIDDGMAQIVLYSGLPEKLMNAEALLKDPAWLLAHFEETTPYLIDGIIIEVTDDATKKEMGATEHHHRWMAALKQKGETAQTTQKSTTWQAGRTGIITPVLEIDTVRLSGADINRVSGHNLEYMKNHGLGAGARIEIIRSGEVIPKHVKTIEPVTIVVPYDCPACGEPTSTKTLDPHLYCANESCSAKLLSRLEHFFFTMGNVDLFGPKTLEKLIEFKGSEIRDVVDIYCMDSTEFTDAGFGVKQSANMMAELDRTWEDSTDDFKFLAALGIPLLGKGDSKKLLKVYPLEELYTVSELDIAKIDGLGDKKAASIHKGLRDVKDVFDWFKEEELFETLKRTPLGGATEQSPITGKHICFTGTFASGSRGEVEANAERLGAVVQKSVNKKTDYLVYGKKLGASKQKAADANSVMIIEEQFYLDMINSV